MTYLNGYSSIASSISHIFTTLMLENKPIENYSEIIKEGDIMLEELIINENPNHTSEIKISSTSHNLYCIVGQLLNDLKIAFGQKTIYDTLIKFKQFLNESSKDPNYIQDNKDVAKIYINVLTDISRIIQSYFINEELALGRI